MFLINEQELLNWKAARSKDQPPYTPLKDAIQAKLSTYPLIEYGRDEARILREREQCLVNAPQGRIMRDDQGMGIRHLE